MRRGRKYRRLSGALRSLGREQHGFTVIEGVVGALLLTVGALATLQVLDAGTRNTYRAEESQVLNNRLQAELEEIRRLPYSEIALTEAPAASGDPNDPRWRVSGSRYALDRSGAELAEMVVDGGAIPGGGTVEGGQVEPGPEPFSAGDISGEIYRFVAWTGDPECPECGAGLVKRVVVAATVDEAAVSFERAFQEIQTEIVDPEATLDDNPAPYEDEIDAGTGSLWLTDTPCDASGPQPPAADHAAHDTRARCADGPQTGGARGAPDLMAPEAPELDPEYPAEEQPVFDYATDSEPAEGGAEDLGIAMPWPSNDSCVVEPVLSVEDLRKLQEGVLEPLAEAPEDLDGLLDLPGADPNKQLRRHTWLSPPVSGSGAELLGKATLELFSKTVNGAVHPGEICVSLFVRQTVDVPVCADEACDGEPLQAPLEIDVPVVNVGPATNLDGTFCHQGLSLPYFRCSRTTWPGEWTKVPVPMEFSALDSTGAQAPLVLADGDRIGVSVMVKKGGTAPGAGLEFMYDAVGFESRLELETDQLIAFG